MAIRVETFDKENEFNFGTATKAAFKAFDKITDLIPAKYGLKMMGKAIGFTHKFAQGMSKITLILYEAHRLWHMFNEVINENKETIPMISKESLERYTKDIDRDLARLDADKKDYQKKLEEYKTHQEDKNLNNEITEEEIQKENRGSRKRLVIAEYQTITEELTHKLKEVSDTDKLEEKLEGKNVEIENAKEELKQKNPSYDRAQKHYKEKRLPKIPELIPIPNN